MKTLSPRNNVRCLRPLGLGSEGGLTLLELMIVVSIIAIVASIALPNFQRYQAKSSQAEARTNLAAIYGGQLAYFAEIGSFGNIQQIEFRLAGQTNRYTYRTGAASPGGGVSTGTPNVDVLNAGSTFTVTAENTIIAASNAASTAVVPGFTATATGNLDNDLTIDMWHVNDKKQDVHFADSDDAKT